MASLPPVPASIDWGGKVPLWGMLGNDSVGDCGEASALHCEMLWTADASNEFVPTTQDAIDAYSSITGYDPADPSTDQGTVLLDLLNYWRIKGIAGHKIFAYAAIDPSNTRELMGAIAFFGCAYVGVNLPASATQATDAGEPWSNATDTNIEGGHAIPLVAYDQNTLTCITWGQRQTMTWPWLRAYLDESYVVFSGDWIGLSGTAPSGFNVAQLTGDLAAL
jgi:hypothetical protein